MIIEAYDYPLFFFYGLLLFLITKKILKKQSTALEYKWFMYGWFAKMAACLVYTWTIIYYYGYGDTLTYYQLGDVLRNAILKDLSNISYFFQDATSFKQVAPAYTKDTNLYLAFDYYNNSNFAIHKLSCLASFFTFNRFLLISLVFANLSFWGYMLIYKGLKQIFPAESRQIAFAAFFIPSCIFWSSGLIKEPVCILCEGIIFYYVVSYLKGKKPDLKAVGLVLLSGYVLFTVKNYIFLCLVVGILLWLAYYFIEKLFERKPILKFGFILLLISTIAVQSILLWNSIQTIMLDNVGEIIATNATIYKNTYNYQSGGSLIQVDFDRSNAGSVLLFLPQALVNVLFRPWPWEISNPLMVLTVLENLFFLFLFAKTLFHTRFFTRKIGMNTNFQILALTFSITLALIIGISTFNFGTLVRYRIPFLPFWVFFLLICSKKEKGLVEKPLKKYTLATQS